MATTQISLFENEPALRGMWSDCNSARSHHTGDSRGRFLERPVSVDVRKLSRSEKRKRTEQMIANKLPAICGVYLMMCPDGSYYVGMSKNMEQRQRRHVAGSMFRHDKQANKAKADAIRKYGKEVRWSVLTECDTVDEAVKVERAVLDQNHSDQYCLNIARGNYCQGVPPRNNTRQCYLVYMPTGSMVWFDAKKEAALFASGGRSKRHLYSPLFKIVHTRAEAVSVCNEYKRSECISIAKSVKVKQPKARKYCTAYEFITPAGHQVEVSGVELFRWYKSTLPPGTKYRNRRKSMSWYVINAATPSKKVVIYGPEASKIILNSIEEAARYLSRSATSVRKALTKEHNTCNGHRIEFLE